MTIIEFLEARLAEDEAVARSAAEVDGEEWGAVDPFGGEDYDRVEGSGDGAVGHDMYYKTVPHVALHDPARVLREVGSETCTDRPVRRRLLPFVFELNRW